MTVYYQLENMLVAGFKSQEEYDRYLALVSWARRCV